MSRCIAPFEVVTATAGPNAVQTSMRTAMRKKPKYSDGRYQNGYRNSRETDVAKTWAEARKKLEEEKKKRELVRKELESKLTVLRKP